jgi:hypothetical protein
VAFVNAELEKVRAIPGVVTAGAISRIPLTVTDQATFYLLAGQTNDEAREQVALSRVVSRDYFAAVSARLREGRFFDTSDRKSESPAAIVNESFANRNYPGRSAIGARFQFGRWGDKAYWYTIVGVVKEIRDRGVAEELKPTIYRMHEQADQSGDQPSGIVVRTSVEPASIVAAVRQAIWSVDKNQPETRPEVDAYRACHWFGAGGRRGALDDHDPLRIPAQLSPDCRRGISHSPGSGSLGLFCSRASRGECRSAAGSSPRINSEGGFLLFGIIRETDLSEISIPSLSNSPWIREAPQSGLVFAICLIRSLIRESTGGRPLIFRLVSLVQGCVGERFCRRLREDISAILARMESHPCG